MAITRLVHVPAAAAVVATLVIAPMTKLGHGAEDGEREIPFDVAQLFFELNDTDGDLGIHALIDGEPWKKLEIENPHERQMLSARVRGRLCRQGLTEIFFESAEPTFDELVLHVSHEITDFAVLYLEGAAYGRSRQLGDYLGIGTYFIF